MNALPLIAATLFAFGAPITAAEQVYRCGPDGRLYQNKPCEHGKVVDVADPRSAEQQKSAKAAAKTDAKLADTLERDRRARESSALPAQPSGFNARPAAPQSAASKPPSKKEKRKASPPASQQISEKFVPAAPKAPATDTRKP